MSFDPDRHHRRSIRLPDYDYSQPGGYYVTICAFHREHLFGDIHDGLMHLNRYGEIVSACWYDLPLHYPHLMLDAFVVMPNHIHAVFVLTDHLVVARADFRSAPADLPTPKRHGLPMMVNSLKSFSARQINRDRHTPGVPV